MKKELNVVGSGYMGSQISSLFCLLDYKVNIFYNWTVDFRDPWVNIFYNKNKNEKIFNNNLKLLGKKLKLNPNNIKFKYNNNLNELNDHPVIECVSEDLDIKKKIFQKIFRRTKNNIFSNTSSINIKKISEKISILHFMNPVFLGIVEVFKSNDIDDRGLEIIDLLKKVNFITINNKSQEDIVLNKLIFSEISEFFNLIENQRTNKFELLKSINKLKGNNILHTIDIIGLDTCLKIVKNLNISNKNFYVPKIFELALKENILGKKNKSSINSIFLSRNYPY